MPTGNERRRADDALRRIVVAPANEKAYAHRETLDPGSVTIVHPQPREHDSGEHTHYYRNDRKKPLQLRRQRDQFLFTPSPSFTRTHQTTPRFFQSDTAMTPALLAKLHGGGKGTS